MPTERRLAAIMVADVAGYSALMERAEEATAGSLTECHALITREVGKLGGRVFNRAGDAALAEFPSPVNAVVCAVEIQKGTDLAEGRPTDDKRLRLRIGLHLDDVIVSDQDLIGDGVNIAARIQQAAEPGHVWVSEAVFNQVRRHSPFTFDDLGAKTFKNISEPIRVYRVRGEMTMHRWHLAPTRNTPPALPARKGSIAVMPFTVQGLDEEQRYFADGLTDDLIVELGRFKPLFVISRSASFVYEGRPVDARQVGRELGVRYVLEGQVRRRGGDIVVSLILTNTETGEAVWTERISRPQAALFEMLDKMVGRIAATVMGRLESADIAEARRKPPQNMTAYDFLLRGLDHHRQSDVTRENLEKAVEWFDRAIEADPTYGAAYAWRICAASGLPGFSLEKDLHYAQRAIELDPNNAEAHRIMGSISMEFDDFGAAEHHFRRAMELNPSDANIMARSACFYTYNGDPGHALELLAKAQELDPFLPAACVIERGVALYAAGRYEEACEALESLPLQTPRSRLYQAAAHKALGQTDKARELVQRTLRLNRELKGSDFMTEEVYKNRETRAELRQRLEEAGFPFD